MLIPEKDLIFSGNGIFLKIFLLQEIRSKQCLKPKIFFPIKTIMFFEIPQRNESKPWIVKNKNQDVLLVSALII